MRAIREISSTISGRSSSKLFLSRQKFQPHNHTLPSTSKNIECLLPADTIDIGGMSGFGEAYIFPFLACFLVLACHFVHPHSSKLDQHCSRIKCETRQLKFVEFSSSVSIFSFGSGASPLVCQDLHKNYAHKSKFYLQRLLKKIHSLQQK